MRANKRPIVERLESRVHLSAGDLDPTFSGDGRATISLGSNVFSAEDVAVQSNGKTIVVGECIIGGPLFGKIIVARYDAAGNLDTTFGGAGTGIASTDYLEFNSSYTFSDVAAVAIQPADNKIVVLGHVTQGFFQTLTLTRFTADGLLDTTFSGDGKVLLHNGFDDLGALAADVAIQPDGKIVLVCSIESYDGRDQDFGIARYNSNGTLDNSFSGDGRTTVGFGHNEFASELTIDPHGRIVVVGYSSPSSNASDRQFAIARLTPGGSLDSSFSGDGRVLSRFTGGTLFSSGRGVVVQPSGKIVIVGEVGSGNFADHNTGLFRLNDNGTGDPTFGVGNGQIEIDFGGQDAVNSMIAGQTGRLLVGGTVTGGLMTIACLTADGQLDPIFSGDGKQTVSFGDASSARGLALAPNGTFVAAGGRDFATARLFDRKFATISIGTFQPQMFEQGQQGTSFLITRQERLTSATRVYIGTGGQATPPNALPLRPRDYFETVTNPPTPPVIFFGNGQTSTTYLDIPANETFVSVNLTPVDDTFVEGDELAIFTIGQNAAYDVAANGSTTLVIRDNDVAPPAVIDTGFHFETYPQNATITFNHNVQASFTIGDLIVTGPESTPPAYSLNYNNVTNTGTVVFYNGLTDGDYTVTVKGSGVTFNGVPMSGDHTFGFFFMAADANRDRVVNLVDFNILAANFGQAGRTFSQGNFDYDPAGNVNLADFNILAGRFGSALGTMSVAGRATPFGGTRVIDLIDDMSQPA